MDGMDNETRELEKRAKNTKRYCRDLLSQMQDNERTKIEQRNQWYKDGIDMDEEHRKRIRRLEDTKVKKLLELRSFLVTR